MNDRSKIPPSQNRGPSVEDDEQDDPISGNHHEEEEEERCHHSVSVGINVATHKTIVDYLLYNTMTLITTSNTLNILNIIILLNIHIIIKRKGPWKKNLFRTAFVAIH